MKVLMIFDQTQAGLGGKESPDLPMGGKQMAIGSCHMFEKVINDMGGTICATLYCGDGTFASDPETNGKKFALMSKKLNPDVVICGPCFNYGSYGKMAAKAALTINELTDIPAFAIMSEECGEAIKEFKDKVTILKMPKKGGTGLPQSLSMMSEFALKLAKKEDVSEMVKAHAY